MPPRPRRDRPNDARPPRSEGGGAAGGGGRPGRAPVDPEAAAADVARFAQLVRDQAKREQAKVAQDRKRAAEERKRVDEAQAETRALDDARTAKERAARRLKDVRARGNNAAVAEAEAAYKQALADLVALESGERPAWAPPPPEPEPEAPSDEAPSDAADGEANADEAGPAAAEAEAPTEG